MIVCIYIKLMQHNLKKVHTSYNRQVSEHCCTRSLAGNEVKVVDLLAYSPITQVWNVPDKQVYNIGMDTVPEPLNIISLTNTLKNAPMFVCPVGLFFYCFVFIMLSFACLYYKSMLILCFLLETCSICLFAEVGLRILE